MRQALLGTCLVLLVTLLLPVWKQSLAVDARTRSQAGWQWFWNLNSSQIKMRKILPSPTPTPTLRPTSTPTNIPTPTFTPTPTSKPTNTPTPTIIFTPTTTPTPTVSVMPTPVAENSHKWGAYVGWQENDLQIFEERIGQSVDIQATFVHWGNENEFPVELASHLKGTGKTLVIFWEAMDYNLNPANQPNFSYDKILSGNWDSYLTSFAASVRSYGDPVIIIPFEEMNGDWYNWSGVINGNTPAKHIAAYRYVRKFFNGIANAKLGWAVNQESVPDTSSNKIENYYPGNDYVDYVGVNGFNFGSPWLTFDEVFGPALQRLKVYQKPMMIFSMASADGARKAEWIKDALTVQLPKYPELSGWVWFNENKEHDWRVWSDVNSLEAFKAGLP